MTSSLTTGSYTALDAERAAKNPAAFREDTPPSLRFENDTVEDREESVKQGRMVHAPCIKVFIRAHGDNKSEVPYIAEGWRYEPKTVDREVKKLVYRSVEKEIDGVKKWVDEEREITETIQEEYKFRVATTPWEDQLKERVHNGRISPQYMDYCMDALKRFKAGSEMPINGTPIVGWNMIDMAMQRNCVDLGINTIELCAVMTDEAMDALGMGSRDVKKKAIAYTTASEQGISITKVAALQSENEQLRGNQSALEEKFAALAAKVEAGDTKVISEKGKKNLEQKASLMSRAKKLVDGSTTA